MYTLEDLEQDASTLMQVMEKHLDYKEWFTKTFPSGAQSGEEVLSGLNAQVLSKSNPGFEIEDATLVKYTGSNTVVVVPATVKYIKDHAFANNKDITDVTVPDGVISIGGRAFSGCEKLKTVRLPDTVKLLGENAFTCCDDLTDIRLSDNIEEIPYECFNGCDNLRSITLPKKLKYIGDGAFSCSGIESIHMPSSVKTIDYRAFESCKCLHDIQLNKGLCYIGEDVFKWCERLGYIKLPDTLVHFGLTWNCADIEFKERVYGSDNKWYYAVMDNKYFLEDPENFEVAKICDGIKFISKGFFYGGHGPRSIILPDSVVELEYDAFWSLWNLEEITLSKNIKRIPKGAFGCCEKLKEIVIPDGVREIEDKAFFHCTALEKVHLPDRIRKLGDWCTLESPNVNFVYKGDTYTLEEILQKLSR